MCHCAHNKLPWTLTGNSSQLESTLDNERPWGASSSTTVRKASFEQCYGDVFVPESGKKIVFARRSQVNPYMFEAFHFNFTSRRRRCYRRRRRRRRDGGDISGPLAVIIERHRCRTMGWPRHQCRQQGNRNPYKEHITMSQTDLQQCSFWNTPHEWTPLRSNRPATPSSTCHPGRPRSQIVSMVKLISMNGI